MMGPFQYSLSLHGPVFDLAGVACVLLVLAIVAWVDARTGRVPSLVLATSLPVALLFFGFETPMQVFYAHAAWSLSCVLVLWGVNEACVRLRGHDAFGMGDVKWSGVVAFLYGGSALFWSWIIGAWLALAWMGIGRICKKKNGTKYAGHAYVHFVPFLFVGLVLALLFGL